MDLGDAFSWGFKDPRWFGKFLVIGLIFIIPVIGWINAVGWMLTCLDYRRQGYQVLPEAGFQYIGRGINVFLVELVYGVVIAVIFFVLFGLTIGSTAAINAAGGQNTLPPFPLGGLGFPLFGPLLSIAVQLFYPSVIVATEHGGIAGGLNVVRVVEQFSRRPGPALLSALMFWVAGYIGGLGCIACCVGILVTLPYSYTIMAATLAGLERELGLTPPAASAYPPPPPPTAPPPPAMPPPPFAGA